MTTGFCVASVLDLLHPEVLQQIALLEGLSPTECRQLVEIATTVDFNPGEIVLHQGQRGQRLWILLEGKCEVFVPATNGNISRQLVSAGHARTVQQFRRNVVL